MARPAPRDVKIDDWLPRQGGIAHLFGRDDEALTSYALEIVRRVQDKKGNVLWISTAVPPTEWLMDAKQVRPDAVRLTWSCAEIEPLVKMAVSHGFFVVIWERPSASRSPVAVAIDDFTTRSSWAISAQLNSMLPRLRRLLESHGGSLVLVNRASRRPNERLYQPCFGGVIKRAGAPFLTAYLKSNRNPDYLPRSAAEAEALRRRLSNVTGPAFRLTTHELRLGVPG